MIGQYICGGFIILLSLIFNIIGICVMCKGEINGFLLTLVGIVFIFPGILVITSEDVPIKQDVLDGKAVYQETQIITGNDTIKTYEIVWKKENF